MTVQPYSCLIGVDGGGTACRMAVQYNGRRTEVRAARANVHSDPEGAVATLVAGLGALAEAAGLTPDVLRGASAHLGLAGVVASGAGARVAARLPVARAQVGDDRLTALVGALGDSDGAVMGIGTGSYFGRQKGGVADLRGGWGFLLGDEASGGWLGRQALMRTLHMADGLQTETPLLRALEARFGGSAGIVDFAGTAKPGDVAALAPQIVAAASAGDACAQALMREGAAYLVRGLGALAWSAGEPLCLMGGLAPHYAAWLPDRMRDALAAPKGSALDGALALAARAAETEHLP